VGVCGVGPTSRTPQPRTQDEGAGFMQARLDLSSPAGLSLYGTAFLAGAMAAARSGDKAADVPVWVGARCDRIVFLTGPGKLKARNLRRDPRLALSIAPADDPFTPVAIRGRVVEWLEGDEAWEIIDQLSAKYTGRPYSRGQERLVAVIEPESATPLSAPIVLSRVAEVLGGYLELSRQPGL
jgi:hypothetical protein